MKKLCTLACASLMLATVLTGCGTDSKGSDSKNVLKIAAFKGGNGDVYWKNLAKEFEKENKGVKVELTVKANIDETVRKKIQSGKDVPDIIHYNVGQPSAFTETMIKEEGIEDISDVFDMKAKGEKVAVKDKLVDGFLDNSITQPYGNGKTYLAPLFYGPCGLFYNAGLLKQKGWTLPTTWDEMFALGDKAKAEGISLFTYPTTGYFDAFLYALIKEVGGADFYAKALKYDEATWSSDTMKEIFALVGKLATYTEPTTVANANNDNFKKNQQLVLDNKALFIPNGSWLVGEMADAPKAEGFEWGFTGLPAYKAGGESMSYTFFEQMYIPAKSENKELAKKFVAFMYSDKAVDIMLNNTVTKDGKENPSPVIQPVKGIVEKLDGDNKLYYSIYENGVKPVMGALAATKPVEGVSMPDTLFGTVNSIVSGDKTVEEWQNAVVEVCKKLAPALIAK